MVFISRLIWGQWEVENCIVVTIFSERELAFTIAICYQPSVCCLSVVVCLSVCLWRWCTLLRRLNFSAIFFHHTIAQGLYSSGAKNRWWGRPFSPEICVQSDPPPLKQRNFDQYRLIAPQPWYLAKKVRLALIGSRPRAFQRAIDEPCTLPLSPPKGGTKTRYRCLCQ